MKRIVLRYPLELLRYLGSRFLGIIGGVIFGVLVVGWAFVLALVFTGHFRFLVLPMSMPLFHISNWLTALAMLLILLFNPSLSPFGRKMVALGAVSATCYALVCELSQVLPPIDILLILVSCSLLIPALSLVTLAYELRKQREMH